MSRLETQQRKKYYNQLATYLILFILIIIFFATIGLKLLVNSSLFIAGLSQKNSPAEKQVDERILLPPEILVIPDATNSATIKIFGRAEDKKAVAVYVNSDKQKELIASVDGFETEIKLSEGENEVYVEVKDEEKNISKKSPPYKVIYKNKKPELIIESPKNSEKVIRDEVTINGLTDIDASLKINGLPVVVDSQGMFSQTVSLKEGENTIEVTSSDNAGNSETKQITVIYEK